MKRLLLLISGLLLLFSVEGQILRYSNYTAPVPPEPEQELRGPDELWDGHTVIWLESDTLLTESGGAVSAWTDISNGYVLLPYATDGSVATLSNYPSWTESGGVVFDGTDDVLKYVVSEWTSFGTTYAVVKQVSWTNSDVLFSYAGTGTSRVAQSLTAEGGSPNFHLSYASGSSLAITGLAIGAWGLLTVEIDETVPWGSLQLGDGTPVTNTNTMVGYTSAGVILGATHAAAPALQRHGNVAIMAIIFRNQIDDSLTKAIIKAYLVDKYL